MFNYIRDPDEIYRRSFETLRQESDFSRLPNEIRPLAERLVHACGIPEILEKLKWGGTPTEAAQKALSKGANILIDAEMVGSGIIKRKLPRDNAIICTLNDPRTLEIAKNKANTRSAAAVELWHINHGFQGIIDLVHSRPITDMKDQRASYNVAYLRRIAAILHPALGAGAAFALWMWCRELHIAFR